MLGRSYWLLFLEEVWDGGDGSVCTSVDSSEALVFCVGRASSKSIPTRRNKEQAAIAASGEKQRGVG